MSVYQNFRMKINADLYQRAVVATDDLPWQDSLVSGITRRLIESDGGEVARATSIERFAPGSQFTLQFMSWVKKFWYWRVPDFLHVRLDFDQLSATVAD